MSSSAPHPVSSTSAPSDPAAAISTPAAAPAVNGGGVPRPPKEKKAKKEDGLAAGMNALELDPKPEFLASRIEMFERLQKEAVARIAGECNAFVWCWERKRKLECVAGYLLIVYFLFGSNS